MVIGHVPPFNDSKLELVLVSVRLGIITSVAPSENQGKSQSIDESIFLKADS